MAQCRYFLLPLVPELGLVCRLGFSRAFCYPLKGVLQVLCSRWDDFV